MGTSTDGQICYGIAFDDGHEFPWGADSDNDIEEWWIATVHGFNHSFELFDETGNYLNGQKPPEAEITRYFAEKRAFAETRPLPVALVNYCSSECPMYALAVPRTVMTAGRGYPTAFDPSALTVTDAEREALLKFCADYGIELSDEPTWLLTSYWG